MRHALVVQLARFGDLIQTKRLLGSLALQDDTRVHLVVDHSLRQLAGLVYSGVEIHGVHAHGTGLGPKDAGRILSENLSSFQELADLHPDEVYNLNFSGLNFRLAALFDPATVRGYRWKDGQELIDPWPALAMRWSKHRRLAPNLMDFWAGYAARRLSPDKVNPPAQSKGGGVGVVLAGRMSRRSLPPAVLAQVAAAAWARFGRGTITLLGSASEAAAGKALVRELPGHLADKTVNLAGTTGWGELMETVGSLDVLLTPDTGTMHLACHLGTPVLAFFLSSAWAWETGPYGEGHTVYQSARECSPCLESQDCPFQTACLAPFADPSFQRFLNTAAPQHAPREMLALRPEFDRLGQTYVPFAGYDPDADTRAALRTFIAQHLDGIEETGGGPVGPDPQQGRALADALYVQRDWCAPPPGSGSGPKERP